MTNREAETTRADLECLHEPCQPGEHLWNYEATLTPPLSPGTGNVTIYRCRRCSYAWDGSTASYRTVDGRGKRVVETIELIERTATPREAADAVIAHYTGESIPGQKNVRARNKRLRRRLRNRRN